MLLFNGGRMTPTCGREVPIPDCLSADARSFQFFSSINTLGVFMKRTRTSWYGGMFRLMSLLLLIGSAALAAVPGKPLGLRASAASDGQGRYIALTWSGDSTASPMTFYDIYQKLGDSKFDKVGQTFDSSGWGGYYRTGYLQTGGKYTFYVVARNRDGAGPASDQVTVTLSDVTVRFVSVPTGLDSITAGETYTRTLVAEASNGEPVTYTLLSANGKIDQNTGVFTYTSTGVAYIGIHVRASLKSDPSVSVESRWEVIVRPDERSYCGMIYGLVKDAQTGQPIEWATLSAFPFDSAVNATTVTGEVRGGVYMIRVPKGEYQLFFNAGNYKATWYTIPGQSGYGVVKVGCDDSARADVAMEPIKRTVYDTVKGQVTRKSDGSGVKSLVVFSSFDPLYSDTVVTSEDGTYEVILPHGTYIGYAHSQDRTLKSAFYGDTENSQQSTRIVVDRTLYGIDFHLESVKPTNGMITGLMADPAGRAIEGVVAVYQLVDSAGRIEQIPATTTWVPNGRFSIPVAPGRYILLGIPGDSLGYTAGYYRLNAVASRSWDKATIVQITPNLNTVEVVIKLQPSKGAKGSSNLKGQITVNKGVIKQDRTAPQGANPLEGAVVYAIDAADEVSGFGITNDLGEFTIVGLGIGTYSVVADRVGYETSTGSVTFTAEGTVQQIDVPMQEAEAVSGVETPAAAGVAVTAYPNPARESVTLRFPASAGSARVTVVTATGAEAATSEIETIEGTNSFRIDTRGLAAGVYFVRITAGGTVGSATVTIIR